MNSSALSKNPRQGFTLIELLVVIAIIAILASLLLPAIHIVIQRAKIKKARMEIEHLVLDIKAYEAKYGRYPVSNAVMSSATASHSDFTYCDTSLQSILGPASPTANNSEVVAILMDIEKYPNTGLPTANAGHVKNTQQIRFLDDVKMVGTANEAGVGPDLVYRDPWGNPYIISMDLNYDEKCQDALYHLDAVSQQSGQSGYNGLFSSTASPNSFEYPGGLMVWSLGPDAKADGGPANAGLNKDNILSWK